MIPKELCTPPEKITLEDFEFNCIIVSTSELLRRLKNLRSGKHSSRVNYFVPAMIKIVENELLYRRENNIL